MSFLPSRGQSSFSVLLTARRPTAEENAVEGRKVANLKEQLAYKPPAGRSVIKTSVFLLGIHHHITDCTQRLQGCALGLKHLEGPAPRVEPREVASGFPETLTPHSRPRLEIICSCTVEMLVSMCDLWLKRSWAAARVVDRSVGCGNAASGTMCCCLDHA